MKTSLLIAIDGPSASGKGTVAKKLAQYFKLPYLNTGALYRAVAWRILQQKISIEQFSRNIDNFTQQLHHENLENEELFSEKTGEIASIIAKNPILRQKLVDFQQNFIKNGILETNGVVLDGRDIASVIMPEAQYKFYITADVEIRAKRRFDQLKKQGKNISYEEILAQLKKRDENDSTRKDSPLIVAKNAIIIDNGNLSIEEGFMKILNYIEFPK